MMLFSKRRHQPLKLALVLTAPLKLLVSLSVPLLLGACASLGSAGGGILVETVSSGAIVSGATCTLTNGGGSQSVVTPGSAVVRVNGDLHVTCEKPGYLRAQTVVHPSYRANGSNASLGIGVGGGGGHVGVDLGVLIPLALGSGTGEYPAGITVEMALEAP